MRYDMDWIQIKEGIFEGTVDAILGLIIAVDFCMLIGVLKF